MIDFCSLTSLSYPPTHLFDPPDNMGEQANKQTNKQKFIRPQAYTSHSKAYEATEEGLKLLLTKTTEKLWPRQRDKCWGLEWAL